MSIYFSSCMYIHVAVQCQSHCNYQSHNAVSHKWEKERKNKEKHYKTPRAYNFVNKAITMKEVNFNKKFKKPFFFYFLQIFPALSQPCSSRCYMRQRIILKLYRLSPFDLKTEKVQ